MSVINQYTPYKGTDFSLEGKTAVVTGAAGLLGRVFLQSLLSAGAEVVAVDINLDNCNKTDIDNQYISKLHLYQIDITDENAVDEFVKEVNETIGCIDVLVNSAAIDPKFDKESKKDGFTTFINFPLDQWNQSIDVNLTGTFIITRAICAVMEMSGKGSIINLGSNYGLVGPDQRIYKKKGADKQLYKPAIYSVCKAAIDGFTKYLASYYSGTEIRVNTLTPAGIYNNQDDEFVSNYANRTILRRMSDREEYKGAILFLASDASSYMTGANLVIDGGWTAL